MATTTRTAHSERSLFCRHRHEGGERLQLRRDLRAAGADEEVREVRRVQAQLRGGQPLRPGAWRVQSAAEASLPGRLVHHEVRADAGNHLSFKALCCALLSTSGAQLLDMFRSVALCRPCPKEGI